MDYQPHHLEFLWVCWFEVIEGHQKQNVYKLDILHFIPMDVDNAFGFVNPIDVLRSCHLIPDFSRGKLHPNCQIRLRACWDAHDAKQYYVNWFVFWLITWRWLVILITFIDLLIKTCSYATIGVLVLDTYILTWSLPVLKNPKEHLLLQLTETFTANLIPTTLPGLHLISIKTIHSPALMWRMTGKISKTCIQMGSQMPRFPAQANDNLEVLEMYFGSHAGSDLMDIDGYL